MPKKGTDLLLAKALKLGVREDHAKAVLSKGAKDEDVEAYREFVDALEEQADKHFIGG